MAKRRETVDTTRLTANLINPKPETDDHGVKAFPATKTQVKEIPAINLLNEVREVGEWDFDAIRT